MNTIYMGVCPPMLEGVPKGQSALTMSFMPISTNRDPCCLTFLWADERSHVLGALKAREDNSFEAHFLELSGQESLDVHLGPKPLCSWGPWDI